MKRAFVFPGQGSQFIGMGKDLYDNFDLAKYIFNEIDDALKFNLSELIFNGTMEELSLTEHTQPALMAVSLCIIQILSKDFGVNLYDKIDYVAGHSLGEYSAYAAAGSVAISDTAKLLKIRGQAMQNAVPAGKGAMFALLGATTEEAEIICNKCSTNDEILNIANDNCPGQIVLSGSVKAVEDAILMANSLSFKAIKLKVSAPFHSLLIEDAQPIMQEALGKAIFSAPKIPLIANVTARPVIESEIKELLVKQITARVRWNESINYLIENDVNEIIEIGAGKVLTNLNKRINSNIKALSVSSPEEIEQLAELLS